MKKIKTIENKNFSQKKGGWEEVINFAKIKKGGVGPINY